MIGEKLQIEKLAAVEAARLFQRDRKTYLGMIAGLYGCSLLHGVKSDDARLARATYFFARHIDDALDGEHVHYTNRTASPTELPLDITKLKSSSHPIVPLGNFAIKGLLHRQQDGDSPMSDLQRLVDSMVFDYQRSRTGTVFKDNNELESYFSHAMRASNIMLIGFRSQLREDTDFPTLANGLGRVYSARDLTEDWTRDVINIPQGPLDNIREDLSTISDWPTHKQLTESSLFCEWQTGQLDLARNELNTAHETAADYSHNDTGARVIALLTKRAMSYIPQIEGSLTMLP